MKSLTESAVRARAKTQGYILKKARTSDPMVAWHGTYMLVDFYNRLTLGDPQLNGYGESLESIAEFLDSGNRPSEKCECTSCGAEFENADKATPLYECQDCGTQFTRESSLNGNHQCPQCNKFATKVSDLGCPECNEGELEREIDIEHINRALEVSR